MNYVLDTNIVIYAQKGALAEPLPIGRYFISIITEIELYSYPNLSVDQQLALNDLMRDVTTVGIEPEVKRRAIELRRANRLRVPDPIIAATALHVDAELLTNDTALIEQANLRCRKLMLQPSDSRSKGN